MRRVLDRVTPLARRFRDAGHRVHLVGGVVRDLVLGRESVDLDLATNARPGETKAIVGDWADDVWSQGERFGTIGCRRGDDVYEITTYRADAYDPASRNPVVEFGDTLEGDLVRRDFTINAMALDPLDGVLVDPHDGRRDLDQRVLRTPGPADVSFDDDPLRMLRAARFVARFNLDPTPELVASMRSHAPRLDIVSAERIHDELLKLLGGPDPVVGLRLLDEVGLLDRVLPEAVVEPDVLRRTPPDPVLRLAALLRHVDPDALRVRLRALRTSRNEVSTVAAIVRTVRPLVDVDGEWSDAELRRLVVEAGDRADDVRALLRAIDPARGETLDEAWDALAAREDLHAPLPLGGGDVQRELGIPPGREVGEALAFLAELRIEHGPLPEHEQLERMRVWWAERSTRG